MCNLFSNVLYNIDKLVIYMQIYIKLEYIYDNIYTYIF